MSAVLEPELLTLEQALEKLPVEPKAKPTTDTNGNPILYTGPTFTYDPKRKAPAGSGLRIKPDGTVAYHNSNCLKYAAPGSKPFKMPALKPRMEESAATFERLKASIEKQTGKLPNEQTAAFVGRPCIDDTWHIVATDRYRALLLRGPGNGEHCTMFDQWKDKARLVCSLDNPEFHLALKRARVMAEDREPVIRITGTPGHVEVSSEHAEPAGQRDNNDAGSFEEVLEMNNCESWEIGLNYNYAEPVCGSWPLSMWFADKKSPVMFESEDTTWRYVVCPYAMLPKATGTGERQCD